MGRWRRWVLAGAAGAAAGLGAWWWTHRTQVPQPPDLMGKADKVLVLKKQRKLKLLKDGEVLKSYRISLGFRPEGHKEKEGDGKTPEGTYTIHTRNPKSSFHLSLRVDYPNERDRAAAAARGDNPGGDIYIHGLPNGTRDPAPQYRHQDWTWGCIAVGNRDIEEIWHAVDNGTPIEIRP